MYNNLTIKRKVCVDELLINDLLSNRCTNFNPAYNRWDIAAEVSFQFKIHVAFNHLLLYAGSGIRQYL